MRELEELIKVNSTNSIFLMLLDWLKQINKETPDFLESLFNKIWNKIKSYVVLSETSGMNLSKDVILSIGAFAICRW
jgi:DNA polymerase-3 subunit epsilon